MHLSQIHASPESMELAVDFVLLSESGKALKIERYKLTHCAGNYFSAGWAGNAFGGDAAMEM
jgi:hypothetical protein